jgi:putative tricarboxylic transport membrane protein
MRRGWQITAAALLLVFLLFAYESFQLSLRDALGPGPGFFPFWLAVLGAALCIVLFLQLHLGRLDVGSDTLTFDRAGTRSVAVVVAGLCAATALLDVAGFRISMLLLIAFLLVVLGVRHRLAIALCALGGSFGVYHVFFDLLKVPLPVGMLGY